MKKPWQKTRRFSMLYCKVIIFVLNSLNFIQDYFWYRHSRWWEESEEQILNGGHALKRLSVVTTGNAMTVDIACPPRAVCDVCGTNITPRTIVSQNNHRRNSPMCNVATFSCHPSLGSISPAPQTFDINVLRHLSINPVDVTAANWVMLEAVLLRAQQDVSRMRGVEITLHSVVKHYLRTLVLHNTIPPGVNHLLMVLITVSCSEAYCETVGSVLERMHNQRFTNPGFNNEDKNMTKELFLKLNGPDMIKAGPLIAEAARKLSHNHRFATNAYMRTPGNTLVSDVIKSAKACKNQKRLKRRKGIFEN